MIDNTRPAYDENGEPIGSVIRAQCPDDPTGPQGRPKGRPRGDTDYVLAKRAVNDYGYPLAFNAGKIWKFTVTDGWTPCTQHFKSHCDAIKQTSSTRGVLDVVKSRIAIPSVEDLKDPPLYWERIGGGWDGHWAPFRLTDTQILFTDAIVDLKTSMSVPMVDRVIYGPRITLPWIVDGGTEEMTPEEKQFRDLVEHAIREPELRRHFQEVMSTTLMPQQQLRGQIVLWGVPMAGKTTLATAIACAPAGRVGYHTATEHDLVKYRWDTCSLVNKFCNISDESPASAGWASWMKSYTSGVMRTEVKHGDIQSIVPTAKLISTCNEIQMLADPSKAVAQRMFAFRFRYPLVQSGAINSTQHMTAAYWSTPARRNAVLNWLYEGLERLISRGSWNVPPEAIEENAEVMRQGDETLSTLTTLFEADVTSFTPTHVLLAKLEGKMSTQKLARYLATCFPMAIKKKSSTGDRSWGYQGIKVVD